MKTLVAIQSMALVALSGVWIAGGSDGGADDVVVEEWKPFRDYRLRMAETWGEAADRASDFGTDAAAAEFIAESARRHRKAAFAEHLAPYEEMAYVDGEWRPDMAAEKWRAFAARARGEAAVLAEPPVRVVAE